MCVCVCVCVCMLVMYVYVFLVLYLWLPCSSHSGHLSVCQGQRKLQIFFMAEIPRWLSMCLMVVILTSTATAVGTVIVVLLTARHPQFGETSELPVCVCVCVCVCE